MSDIVNAKEKLKFERKKHLRSDRDRIREQMYLQNLQLVDTNKALSLLRTIDTLVLESHEDMQTLCQQMATAIANTAGFPYVSIFIHRPRTGRLDLLGIRLPAEVTKLLPPDALEKAYLTTDDEWIKSSEQFLTVEGHSLNSSTLTKYLHLPQKSAEVLFDSLKLHSIYVTKLTARAKLVGLMVIGTNTPPAAHHAAGPSLLDRLSQAVGVAADNRLLFDENQRIVGQLQKNNQKLKALDEAKDEFISMASHQLRTPLTSMKGYVSMVMEGDAGKPTPMQKKLLSQAFLSSQRMVYLIADLLNVSRLKTGKFVIESVPTNLAEVVESELKQLTETAKSRGLTFEYQKPKRFPALMLDETKIRQVIMNFADNAIYYTPSGGHIEVNLTDTGKSVEFSVKDDGIGVPKDEQHKLFSKFYRAGNARKARPDGTGLGLFMAKKVVVAQGGAIIFRSREGEGSTFGFSFPKAKLKVPK